MNWRAIRALGGGIWRGFIRDRTALFFTILFPLMFLIVFAGIFGGADTSPRPTVVVVGTGAVVDRLPAAALKVEQVADEDAALKRVRDGDAAAFLTQQGDTLTLRYAASDAVRSATVQGIVAAVVDRANVAEAGGAPRYSVRASQVEDESLSVIEFYTPGILGWAISVAGVFGAALTLVEWRNKGVMRRLRLAPVRVGEIGTARVGVSIIVAIVQTVIFLAVGIGLFGLRPSGAWWMAFPIVIVGTLAFLAIGLLVGAVAKTVEAASAMANLVVLPMAFLSGSFFPIDSAPSWVQGIANALPLKHLNHALTDVMVRGQGAASALPEVGILLAFAVVIGVVATRPRVFRWDDA
jgi:ABC-2 type transport system permease protein